MQQAEPINLILIFEDGSVDDSRYSIESAS